MPGADAAASPTPPGAVPRISWVPPPRGFLGLSLLNGALRIVTLGVYHFWGKTEVRQRIWAAIRVDGEPLEYRGTGSELLRGFLTVFFLILVPLGLASLAATLLIGADNAGRGAYEFAAWSLLFLLSGIGIHRARRYRLSRTRWRGIRGGLAGRSAPFAWTYVWTMLLVPVTLGWILPWRTVRLQKLLFDDTRFGDQAFTFTGRAGPLYKRFWLVWASALILFVVAAGMIAGVLALDFAHGLPTLRRPSTPRIAAIAGIIFTGLLIFVMIRAWYTTRVLNYFAAQTQFQGASFKLVASVGSFVWLTASNFVIRVLSLGFLSPIAEARAMRYIVERLTIDGAIVWHRVAQNPDVLLRSGEGLAEAFNVDAF